MRSKKFGKVIGCIIFGCILALSLFSQVARFLGLLLELQYPLFVRYWILSEPFFLFSQVEWSLGLLLEASILTIYDILDFIWTFLSILTGWMIPGSVTWRFNPHCLWDPRFYLNLSHWSHRLRDCWVCYLKLQSSLFVIFLILCEPFCFHRLEDS